MAWRLPKARTKVFGVSAGGELALAMGLWHADVYSAILCISPGGGHKPSGTMPSSLPRTYLAAGTREPFFLENAKRWAHALRYAGSNVVLPERTGSHSSILASRVPAEVRWAFARYLSEKAG